MLYMRKSICSRCYEIKPRKNFYQLVKGNGYNICSTCWDKTLKTLEKMRKSDPDRK